MMKVPPLTKRQRLAILERDDYTCTECGLDCADARRLALKARDGLIAASRMWVTLRAEFKAVAVAERSGLALAVVKVAFRRIPADVDHILQRAMGGTNDPENLQTLCVECHTVKSAIDATMLAKWSTPHTRAVVPEVLH